MKYSNNNSRKLVISSHPLSKLFKNKIQNFYGREIFFKNLITLKGSKSNFEFIKYLIGLDYEEVFIAIEDDSSLNYISILKLICFFISGSNFKIIDSDLKTKTTYKLHLIFEFKNFLYFSLLNLFYFYKLKVSLYFLSNKKNNYKVISRNTKNLRILYIFSLFGAIAGGSVGHVSGIINSFSRKGHKIFVGSFNKLRNVDSNTNYIVLKKPVSGLFFNLNLIRFQFMLYKKIIAYVNNIRNIDFIYQRASLIAFIGVYISKRFNIPLIAEYNGSEIWANSNWGIRTFRNIKIFNYLENFFLQNADFIVTISDALRDELLNRGFNKNKIINYPNCIDPSVFNPDNYKKDSKKKLLKKLGIKEDKIVVTFVGTFGKWHGTEILAEAISKLNSNGKYKSIKNNFHFLFVGDGINHNKVVNFIKNSHSEHLCSFTGIIPQEETPAYINVSDIVVSPQITNNDGSRFFGSPTKLFEYMAMSKAIVASKIEQINDILKNDSKNIEVINELGYEITPNGILVKPNSSDYLLNAIVYLANNEKKRQELGANARKLVLSKYTWDIHTDKILNAYLKKFQKGSNC